MGQYNYDHDATRERRITWTAKMAASEDVQADLSYFDDDDIEGMRAFKTGEMQFLFIQANVVFNVPVGEEHSMAFMDIAILSPGCPAVRNDDLEEIQEVFNKETQLVLDAIVDIATTLTGAPLPAAKAGRALSEMAREPAMADEEVQAVATEEAQPSAEEISTEIQPEGDPPSEAAETTQSAEEQPAA